MRRKFVFRDVQSIKIQSARYVTQGVLVARVVTLLTQRFVFLFVFLVSKKTMFNSQYKEANDVLNYWFGGGGRSKRPKWFGGGEEAAKEVKDKFGPLVS